MTTVDFTARNPFAPEHKRNPHPIYHEMRAASALTRLVEPDGRVGQVLTRYQDCVDVLRDPRWSSNPVHANPDQRVDSPVRAAVGENGLPVLLFIDPPDHTRLRRLVSKAFTPRTVEQLRPRIVDVFDELMAGPTERGELEVMAELAFPLPVTIICELMGVPLEDRMQFHGWSGDAARMLDGDMDEATATRGLMAIMQFVNYFGGLFEERRGSGGADLISQLVAVEEEGDRLSQEELIAITLLLFVAGHETTMNLIGNGLHALLTHRSEFDALAADPSLAPSAVEEALRFNGPVHLTGRIATEQLTVAGETFEKGDQVMTLLAAANRDPAVFDDPDRFDIRRTDNHHLTFSHGLHYCLGAALARVEGQVVLGELARRFPNMQLETTEPQLRDHFVLRGFEELRVKL